MLNWGFELAARLLLVPGPQVYYLTNRQANDLGWPTFVTKSGNVWGQGILSLDSVEGNFPYGYLVEPP